MFQASRVYGWDIETDTSEGHGLTARHPKSRITNIAFAHADGVEVISGDNEARILTDWLDLLHSFPPGLLSDWNGTHFDVPFVADRAKALDHRLQVFWHLYPQPELQPKYDYLDGHTTGYALTFPTPTGLPHQHLDIAYSYKAYAEENHIPWSCKPVTRHALGFEPVELDRANLHKYSKAEVDEYCASDAVSTRGLVIAKLGA